MSYYLNLDLSSKYMVLYYFTLGIYFSQEGFSFSIKELRYSGISQKVEDQLRKKFFFLNCCRPKLVGLRFITLLSYPYTQNEVNKWKNEKITLTKNSF